MKKRILFYLFLIVVAINNIAHAQTIPNITYITPQVFTAGKTIAALSPSNTGGALYPANYSVPQNFVSYTTPFSLAIDGADNVYTTNNSTGDITKYDPSGKLLFTMNTGNIQASEIAIDATGNIFVSQFTENLVLKYSSTGKLLATIKGFNDPYGIAFDSSNNAYVANYLDGNILKISAGDTTAVTYLSGFTNPYGVIIDDANNMYVSEQSVGDVIRVASGTLTRTVLGSGFNGPRHLNKDKSGNIYVADYNNNAIKRISTAGTITNLLPNGLTSPRQAAFDSAGNLFVADYGTNSLKKSLATIYSISDTLPKGLSFNTSTGQITGTPSTVTAAATYTIIAYNTAGKSSTQLTISINAPAAAIKSNDATLSGLTASAGVLIPSFSPQNISYPFTVSDTTSSIIITPTANDGNAILSVNGAATISGSHSAPIALATGSNVITISVTAQDGITTKTYTLNITRQNAGPTLVVTTSTITFPNLPSKTYGDADFTPAAVSNNATMPITYSSDNPSVATIVNNNIHIIGAGTANITASQVGNSTYNPAVSVSKQLVVNPKQILITANAQIKTYGDTDPKLTYMVTSGSLLTGDTFNGILTRDIGEDAGSYLIKQGTLGLSNNYTLTYVGATLQINPSNLIILADNKAKNFGDDNPAFTLSYTGFVNGDNASKLTVQPVVSTTATSTSAIGTYDITVTGAISPNYVINYTNGTLTIKPAQFVNTTPTVPDPIIVHQAVSPNGDGINDYFQIEGLQNYPDNKVTIINQNGTIVYETTNYNNANRAFDGHSNITGAFQQQGTYYYQLEYTANNETKQKMGYLILKY